MKKIKLNIIALVNSESQPSGYTLLFEEVDGNRRLPMIIGAFEARSIAFSLENKKLKYIHTYDLFLNTLRATGSTITEVVIERVVDGSFQTVMKGLKQDGTSFKVDARSAEAIAIGLRFGCTIFVNEAVLSSVGVLVEPSGKVVSLSNRSLKDYSVGELEDLLHLSIEKEDYERASTLRDLILEKKELSSKRA